MKLVIYFVLGIVFSATVYGQNKTFIEIEAFFTEGFLLKPRGLFSVESLWLSRQSSSAEDFLSNFYRLSPAKCIFMSGIMEPPYGDGKESTYDIYIRSDEPAQIGFFIALDVEQFPLEGSVKGDYIGGVYRGEGLYENGVLIYDRSYAAVEYGYREVISFQIEADPHLSSPKEVLATQKMIFQDGKIEIIVKELKCSFS